jgi:hypothetical protein
MVMEERKDSKSRHDEALFVRVEMHRKIVLVDWQSLGKGKWC